MRKFLTIVIYTFIILLIGRNLPLLPKFYLFTTPEDQQNQLVEKMKHQTKQLIKKQQGSYGIYYADLTTKDSFGINEREIFTAASVNKVPIVAALYYLSNKGKIDLYENVTLQEEDIQNYGSGRLRYEEPGSVYTLKTLAKLALQASDNTAAHILAKRIGISNIQNLINQWGLKQTDIDDNKTSAYDMYILFNLLYQNKITNQARTKELLGYMTDTDIEDRLPVLLPKNTNVYHKSGDLQGGIHDVGIIQKDNQVFFLAVMTESIGDKEIETKQTIAQIAKQIMDDYTLQND